MLQIPDTMKNWRWPRRINPHHQEICAASAAWIYKFGDFANNVRWRKVIDYTDGGLWRTPSIRYSLLFTDLVTGLLASLAYATASKGLSNQFLRETARDKDLFSFPRTLENWL